MTDRRYDWLLKRDARVCPKEGCTWRQFGDPNATCPEHGRGKAQPDRPYLGRPVK